MIKDTNFWHLCTDGAQMQDFLIEDRDFIDALNLLAAAKCRNTEVEILTFQLMSNHIHIILKSSGIAARNFFYDYSQSLKRSFNQKEKAIRWSRFNADIYPIPDINALRNEILYVNRNAYVVNTKYTPYSYPWGGGIAFFNPLIKHLENLATEPLSILKKRELLHCRDVSPYKRLSFYMGIALIPTFCNISLAESFFGNARAYHHSLNRNAEAFGVIGERLMDSLVMTDEELFRIAARICNERYGGTKVNLLPPQHKIEVAKELHYRYKANNQQLRRVLRMDVNYLNEIFPNPVKRPCP